MSKPTETTPAAEPEPAAARLRKLPCVVTEHGLAVITRAVALRLAQSGFTAATTPEVYGTALAAIVGEWLMSEADRLQVARKEA
jgi:hypothetical protein